MFALLGNILWLVLGGWLVFLLYLLASFVFFPVLIPLSRLAFYAAWPFGRDVVTQEELSRYRQLTTSNYGVGTINKPLQVTGVALNFLWVITFGWILALTHLIASIANIFVFYLIVTIPNIIGHWKLIGIAFKPFNKVVVTKKLAIEIREALQRSHLGLVDLSIKKEQVTPEVPIRNTVVPERQTIMVEKENSNDDDNKEKNIEPQTLQQEVKSTEFSQKETSTKPVDELGSKSKESPLEINLLRIFVAAILVGVVYFIYGSPLWINRDTKETKTEVQSKGKSKENAQVTETVQAKTDSSPTIRLNVHLTEIEVDPTNVCSVYFMVDHESLSSLRSFDILLTLTERDDSKLYRINDSIFVERINSVDRTSFKVVIPSCTDDKTKIQKVSIKFLTGQGNPNINLDLSQINNGTRSTDLQDVTFE